MYENIGVEEVKSMSDKEDVVIIDVRLKEEWASVRIKGAINIYFGDYDFDEQVEELAKGKTYLIYCQIGVGSLKAIQIMEDLGFEKIYNISGGIKKWKEMEYEVE